MIASVQASELRISRSDCSWLTTYKGGDADYKPGVSVDGKPVAPADLGTPVQIPSDIIISLDIDLAKAYGVGPESPLLEPKAHIGVIVVRGQDVYFNGQKLGDAETAALAAACSKIGVQH